MILLIEDDRNIANLYILKLELNNITTIHATNGLEGLNISKKTKPSLILLDLRMPVMSGEEFLHKYRKDPGNADVPIIILTNLSKNEAPKTIWHHGISGYFVKAHNTPSDLVRIITNILDKA